uniref:Putative ribonuclease H protein At1g65750 n=1 Tax=Anthurium amnicola TaxID=1678845 RepID=A0A1D1Y5Q3_9ARAE
MMCSVWDITPFSVHISTVWNGILQTVDVIWVGTMAELGNGNKARLWLDKWCEGSSLAVSFLSALWLASDPSAPISAAFSGEGGWCPVFQRNVLTEEMHQMVNLLGILSTYALTTAEDMWRWRFSINGSYSVKSIYRLIVDDRVRHGFYSQVWKVSCPLNVKFLAWTISHIYLPTCDTYSKFMDGIWYTCVLCDNVDEDTDHLFIRWPFSEMV